MNRLKRSEASPSGFAEFGESSYGSGSQAVLSAARGRVGGRPKGPAKADATAMAAETLYRERRLSVNAMGFTLIVHAPLRYARFECPEGDSTFSLHKVDRSADHSLSSDGVVVYFECLDLADTVERLLSAGFQFLQLPVSTGFPFAIAARLAPLPR